MAESGASGTETVSARALLWSLLSGAILTVLVFLGGNWLGKNRADHALKADLAVFDSSLFVKREAQLRGTIDSLRAESAKVDTVLQWKIKEVPTVIAAIPDTEYVQNPALGALRDAYQSLAVVCEQCRAVNAALRDSLTSADSTTRARDQRAALLYAAQQSAIRVVERQRDRRPTLTQCSAASLGMGVGGFLLGALK